jgi:hypothetical protein
MALSLDHLQLLTATCTAFLRLAIFFTSDDEAAQAARAELDDTEPFYANLHVELKSLCETLSDWDPAVAVPDVVLTRVLDVLESRFIDRSKVSYLNSFHNHQRYIHLMNLIAYSQQLTIELEEIWQPARFTTSDRSGSRRRSSVGYL